MTGGFLYLDIINYSCYHYHYHYLRATIKIGEKTVIAAIAAATLLGISSGYVFLKLGFMPDKVLLGSGIVTFQAIVFFLACRWFTPSWKEYVQEDVFYLVEAENLLVCWELGQDKLHFTKADQPACGKKLKIPRTGDFARAMSRGKSRFCPKCARIILEANSR